jgi:hypothetical protein
METKQYTTIDKSTWGEGPWQQEPDKVQWQDEDTGLPCLAVRNRLGAWCGYVGVAEGHPYFQQGYNDTDVNIHGGLTFADHCQKNAEDHGICHIPGEGEPDHVWWLGFACAHAYDYMPGMEARTQALMGEASYKSFYGREDIYRTLDFVRAECRGLARQLHALSPCSSIG